MEREQFKPYSGAKSLFFFIGFVSNFTDDSAHSFYVLLSCRVKFWLPSLQLEAKLRLSPPCRYNWAVFWLYSQWIVRLGCNDFGYRQKQKEKFTEMSINRRALTELITLHSLNSLVWFVD